MNNSQNINRQIYEGVNKVSLVPTGSSTSKRGKGAGFYCEVCDLTFKDSIDYSDHLISRQHMNNAGIELVTKRATVEDVKKRLEFLRNKYQKNKEHYDIYKKIEERRAHDSSSKKHKSKSQASSSLQGEEPKDPEQDKMAKMMGFSSFT